MTVEMWGALIAAAGVVGALWCWAEWLMQPAVLRRGAVRRWWRHHGQQAPWGAAGVLMLLAGCGAVVEAVWL